MKTIDNESPLFAETLDQFLDLLATTPLAVDQIINLRSLDQLKAKRSKDEFSLVENVCHLRDLEIEAYTVRISRILREDCPSLEDFDGSRLAVERDYNRQSATEATDEFRRARAENIAKLRTIDASDLRREGQLEGVGRVGLEKLLRMIHEHDSDHLSDMRNVSDWLDRTNQMSE